MSELEQLLTPASSTLPSLRLALFALIAAFLLGQAIGAVYVWTYRGMSYTRSYVHSVAMGAVVGCMIMMAARNNLAAGIGIAGSLSALRLRIALRDPRDMIFIFAGMAAGIACGLYAFVIALAGTAVFCAAVSALMMVEFGQHQVFEGLLRFYAPTTPASEEGVGQILRRYSARFALTTMREVKQGNKMEYAYQLRTRRSSDRANLVRDLQALDGVEGVTLHYQDAAQEL